MSKVQYPCATAVHDNMTSSFLSESIPFPLKLFGSDPPFLNAAYSIPFLNTAYSIFILFLSRLLSERGFILLSEAIPLLPFFYRLIPILFLTQSPVSEYSLVGVSATTLTVLNSNSTITPCTMTPCTAS